jgi:hypothetical protein
MRFTGSVSFRPVRIGFLVPPDDLGLVSKVARLSTCLWGGRFNVMIPFFETGGERWVRPYHGEGGLNVARGYINFFEPDTLVETSPGMAKRLGWETIEHSFGLPRVVSLDQFYEMDDHGRANFVTGVNILEVMQQLYNEEYKYERRHKIPFAAVNLDDNHAFFDLVGGRYPSDAALAEIREAYVRVFSPETLPALADTAMKLVKGGYAGPTWITRHDLKESLGRRSRDQTFYVFDASNAGDAMDYWNYRLIERRVIPINLEWFVAHKEFIRESIVRMNVAIPGNPYGTKFHTTIQFASSISDDTVIELIRKHLNDLPETSFAWARDPSVWTYIGRGRERRETKILATSEAVSFDEQANSKDKDYVRLPAPSPKFLNATGRYRKARWINMVVPTPSHRGGDDAAIVYPTNLWSPNYPRLGLGEDIRIGREGWALPQEHAVGLLAVKPQDGREAIIGWFKTHGIGAHPSEEGQVAAQVIAAAGGLRGSGMFADRETINLLNDMAESHTERTRNGKRVATFTPDRSKHMNTVRQHFEKRAKGSFGYWNELNYFLERKVFRAGLRVQCPTCTYRNWFDLDTISYSPTCTRCLNQFEFSQSPKDLHDADWFYRVVGPFAASDYARGGYAVALTLRCISQGTHHTEMTWTTGLNLQPLNCELDFAAWYRRSEMSDDERDEPLFVIGEAKSFGKNAINEDVVVGLKKVAERFPGAVMIVSSLREASDYTADELRRLRDLALWGRRDVFQGHPTNPLIVLTATELFSNRSPIDTWEKMGEVVHASVDPTDLHVLADMTQKRYLGLAGFWKERMEAHELARRRRRLIKIIETRVDWLKRNSGAHWRTRRGA